jgi:hypothetical protein
VYVALTFVAVIGVLVAVLRTPSPDPSALSPKTESVLARTSPERRTLVVVVDTSNGAADVLHEGKLVGRTPYELQSRPGQQVNLVLRRQGYKDMPVLFEVTERKIYTYTLEQLGDH